MRTNLGVQHILIYFAKPKQYFTLTDQQVIFFLSFSKYQKFQTTSAARTTTHLQKKVLCFDRQSRIFYPLKESVTCKEHIRPTSAADIQRNPELFQLCIFQFKAIPFLLSSHDPVKSPSSVLL